ncbi:MAG: hypothetical protein JO055_00430 [Alphaproteobacteria bacterium]|nr:hypothetical protein [Alphaproteobacteria bacterium]
MRTVYAALLCAATALPFSAPARAEVVNMATITCKDLLESKPDEIGVMLVWLHGYYGGRSGDTKFDVEEFARGSQKIAEHCKQNMSITVMQAIERIFK